MASAAVMTSVSSSESGVKMPAKQADTISTLCLNALRLSIGPSAAGASNPSTRPPFSAMPC